MGTSPGGRRSGFGEWRRGLDREWILSFMGGVGAWLMEGTCFFAYKLSSCPISSWGFSGR